MGRAEDRVNDPRLRVLDGMGRRRWVEAPRMDHGLLADHIDADVVVAGSEALASVDGAAVRDLVLDGAGSMVVRDPNFLDPTSVGVIAHAMETLETVVLAGPGVESPLRAHVDTSTTVERLADAELEALVTAWLGDVGDDLVASLARLTGGWPHLVAPALDRVRAAETELPGSGTDLMAGGRVLMPLVADRPVEDRRWLAVATLVPELADPARFTRLRADGFVDPDGTPSEGIADAALASLPAPVRSEVSWTVVEAAAEGRVDPVRATGALTLLGPIPIRAADTVVAAARRMWATDPSVVLEWTESLPHEGEIGILRVMSLALLGRHSDALALADRLVRESARPEPRMVTAAGLAHGARFEAAAVTYESADPDDSLGYGGAALAAPPRVLIGSPVVAHASSSTGVTAHAAVELAEAAASMLVDSHEAALRLAEAAELAESSEVVLWPDTPHSLAAVLASARFDHETASGSIRRALDRAVGGAAHRRRHQAIAGWVAFRSGRWVDAISAVDDLYDQPLSLRDRFLVSALDLSVRRASSDFADFDRRLDAATELVRRHPLDLTSVFSHGAIARASARMGRPVAAATLLDQLQSFVGSLPVDPWGRLAAWERVGAGLVGNDAAMAAAGADRLAAIDPDGPLTGVARTIADALDGTADVEGVDAAVDGLLGLGAVVDASLLASAAALALPASAAKPLLGRARTLRGRLPSRAVDEASGVGALSDRELDVAYELLAGHRYRDIGERLFISAKTVEHHVANIKAKLGSSSRAEMLSTLRTGLE